MRSAAIFWVMIRNAPNLSPGSISLLAGWLCGTHWADNMPEDINKVNEFIKTLYRLELATQDKQLFTQLLATVRNYYDNSAS